MKTARRPQHGRPRPSPRPATHRRRRPCDAFPRAGLWEWQLAAARPEPDQNEPASLMATEAEPEPEPERAEVQEMLLAMRANVERYRIEQQIAAAEAAAVGELTYVERKLRELPPCALDSGSDSDSGQEGEEDQAFLTEVPPQTARDKFVGHEARDNFFGLYKDSRREGRERPQSARRAYLHDVRRLQLAPVPLLDLTEKTNEKLSALRLDNYYVGDTRGQALGSALEVFPTALEDVSLANVGLGGRGTAAVVRGMLANRVSSLTLSNNRIDADGCAELARMVLEQPVPLVQLLLDGNQLGDRAVAGLMGALTQAQPALRVLDLSRNEVSATAAEAITAFVHASFNLVELRLAYNSVRGEAAEHLAAAVAGASLLEQVDLSFNGLGSGDGRAALQLCAALGHNGTLQAVDLAYNGLSERAAVVAAQALTSNRTLKRLRLDGNPVGAGGAALVRNAMRGALRAAVSMRECNLRVEDPGRVLDVLHPDGTYELDLAEPYARACAAALVDMLDDGLATFAELALGHMTYPCGKGQVDLARMRGVLRVVVETTAAFEVRRGVKPKWFRALVTALEASFDEDAEACAAILLQLAPRYSFEVHQVAELIDLFPVGTSRLERIQVATALLPGVVQGPRAVADNEPFFGPQSILIAARVGLQNLSPAEMHAVQAALGPLAAFNPHNPTGSYRLNLSNPVERTLARLVCTIDEGERRERIAARLVDMSQTGNQSALRNVTLNGLRVDVAGGDWKVPRQGALRFDFTSTRRLPEGARPLSAKQFTRLVEEFGALDAEPPDAQIAALRVVSTRVCLTCDQLRVLLMVHASWAPATRMAAFTTLFSRVTDRARMRHVLTAFSAQQKKQLRHTAGYMHLFNPLDPDERYELDLEHFEQRSVARVAIDMSMAEATSKLEDIFFNNCGTDLPPHWATDQLPARGSLVFRYASHQQRYPEKRRARQQAMWDLPLLSS